MSDPKKPAEPTLGTFRINKDGSLVVYLSKKADPSRPRMDFAGVYTPEQGRAMAHELSVTAIAMKLRPARLTGNKASSVAGWCELWHAHRVARKQVVSDEDDRSRLKNHVLPIIGSVRMVDVTKEMIEDIVTSLDEKIVAGTLNWKTAATTWGVVRTMFRDAHTSKNRELQVRRDDPTIDVRAPERGRHKSKVFLYPDEFWQFMTSETLIHGVGLPNHIAANVVNNVQRWMRCYAMATYLGTRGGELRSLRWDSIDLERMTAHVHIATQPNTGGKIEKDTKTPEGNRTFVIERTLKPLLLAMKGERGGDDRVFPNMPLEHELPSRLRRYLKLAGVTREELYISDANRCAITLHDLRATYLTWRAMRGDPVLVIQSAAGHEDFETTQKYLRVAEDMRGLQGPAGTPFPELPEWLISPRVPMTRGTPKARSLGHASCPAPQPRLKPAALFSKSPEPDNKIASPTGFEPVYMAENGRETACFLASAAKSDSKQPSKAPVSESQNGVADSIGAALHVASLAGRWDVVEQLARLLQNRPTIGANVVSMAEARASLLGVDRRHPISRAEAPAPALRAGEEAPLRVALTESHANL